MTYNLINKDTQKIAFTGTEQECASFLKTYPAGEPPLSFVPVENS